MDGRNGATQIRAYAYATTLFLNATEKRCILAVLVSTYRGGIADQTRTLYTIVGIAPSADFWMGRPFPPPATKNGAFGDDCWVMLEGG